MGTVKPLRVPRHSRGFTGLNYQYYVVSPQSTSEITKIKAFREWLLEEAKADDYVPDVQVDLDRAIERGEFAREENNE
ncbi:hypothetical protein [Kiloniella sp.]|uniref:hypothetical protein n=1 Tax=Kiloniella sp. TaxID=1938587 RepID=UPI003B027C58